jgi:hypothetical protein
MGLVSLFGFSGTLTFTIYSLGTLSFFAILLFAWVLTSLPMLFLLQKDITAIRNKGVRWARSRYVVYILAVVFPSYIITPIYWLVSHRKITNSDPV